MKPTPHVFVIDVVLSVVAFMQPRADVTSQLILMCAILRSCRERTEVRYLNSKLIVVAEFPHRRTAST